MRMFQAGCKENVHHKLAQKFLIKACAAWRMQPRQLLPSACCTWRRGPPASSPCSAQGVYQTRLAMPLRAAFPAAAQSERLLNRFLPSVLPAAAQGGLSRSRRRLLCGADERGGGSPRREPAPGVCGRHAAQRQHAHRADPGQPLRGKALAVNWQPVLSPIFRARLGSTRSMLACPQQSPRLLLRRCRQTLGLRVPPQWRHQAWHRRA